MLSEIKQYFNLNASKISKNLYLRNVFGSGIFKIIGITISFLLVPLLIEFLDKDNYGLWITITSFLGWFGVFDLGVGNGLRNKLTEALSIDDQDKAKVYVSTAYYYMSIIFGIILFVFLVSSIFIDWKILFNAPLHDKNILYLIVLLLFSSFCIQVVLKLILIILTSVHKVAYVEAINAILQFSLFLVVFGLNLCLDGSLMTLAIIYSIIPILLFVGVSFYLFSKEFKYLKPDFKYSDFKEFNDVISLGFKFFFYKSLL
jgi:O-antigen/teichoic acid export membrane protein